MLSMRIWKRTNLTYICSSVNETAWLWNDSRLAKILLGVSIACDMQCVWRTCADFEVHLKHAYQEFERIFAVHRWNLNLILCVRLNSYHFDFKQRSMLVISSLGECSYIECGQCQHTKRLCTECESGENRSFAELQPCNAYCAPSTVSNRSDNIHGFSTTLCWYVGLYKLPCAVMLGAKCETITPI